MTDAAADYDVLIAGAGLVGLSLAPALAAAGLSVALADRARGDDAEARRPATTTGTRASTRSVPAASRSCARSARGRRCRADRIAPVEAMRVEGDAGARAPFLRVRARRARARVDRRGARAAGGARPARARGGRRGPSRPARSMSLTWTRGRVRRCAAPADATLRARLIVGADGASLAGARTRRHRRAPTKQYGQTAVVANFNCERAHLGRAFQWFHDDGGILAWLPLPGRRVSMVWSAPEALARELLALPPKRSPRASPTRGGHALGRLRIASRQRAGSRCSS